MNQLHKLFKSLVLLVFILISVKSFAEHTNTIKIKMWPYKDLQITDPGTMSQDMQTTVEEDDGVYSITFTSQDSFDRTNKVVRNFYSGLKYLYQIERFRGGPDSENGYLSVSNMELSFAKDESIYTISNINILQYKSGVRHDWAVAGPNCFEYFDGKDDKGLLCEAKKEGSDLTFYFLFEEHGDGNKLSLKSKSTQLIFTS
jgi:membrane-associated HD superfamily phosphohydrolase